MVQRLKNRVTLDNLTCLLRNAFEQGEEYLDLEQLFHYDETAIASTRESQEPRDSDYETVEEEEVSQDGSEATEHLAATHQEEEVKAPVNNRPEGFCQRTLECAHPCCGFKDESTCLPCLDRACGKVKYEQWGDTLCSICQTETLGEQPCAMFACEHVFHVECALRKLTMRWDGHIQLQHLDCPICKVPLLPLTEVPAEVQQAINQGERLMKMVKEKAVKAAEIEGMSLDDALRKLAFFECFKCKLPYYGGKRDCAQDLEREETKAEELLCAFCRQAGDGAAKSVCDKHGPLNIQYKCRYCCTVAIWYCYGTTHFCEPCHNHDGYEGPKPCLGADGCPFQGCHAPNGEEFALGCSMCTYEMEALPDE